MLPYEPNSLNPSMNLSSILKINKITILDVEISNVTNEEALNSILRSIKSAHKAMMFFVNAYNLTQAYYNNHYRNILKQTEYIYGDGIGVRIAAALTKQKIKENINGTDLFPYLCELCETEKYSIYFLGGKSGIVEQMIQNLKEKYPSLLISGAHNGYFDHKSGKN